MRVIEPLPQPENLPPITFFLHLVPKADRTLLQLYYQWLLLLAKRGLHLKPLHEKTFNYLYRSISKAWGKTTLLGKLQKEFIARNISLSILLEPVDGFEWISKNRYTLEFAKASPILLQLIMPLSRLIAILNNQRPPFYQPCSGLIFTYAILYVLNMPELRDILRQSKIITEKTALSQQLLSSLDEAKQIISITEGVPFKFKIAYILGLCRQIIKKHSQKAKKNLNFFDYVNAFLYGLWYIATIRDKSRGLNKI